jgi:hypothetical protein
LLNFRDRAELASKDYRSLSTVMEGFVILEKNEEEKENMELDA